MFNLKESSLSSLQSELCCVQKISITPCIILYWFLTLILRVVPSKTWLFKYFSFYLVSHVCTKLPCLFLCLSNIVQSIKKRRPAFALRSLAVIFIPFPLIQTMITILVSFLLQKFPNAKKRIEGIVTSIIDPYLFDKVKKEVKDRTDVEKMKAEVDMAQTFYNSCPSFCLQVLLLIYFPDRRVSWFQYFSIPVTMVKYHPQPQRFSHAFCSSLETQVF